MFLNPWPLLHRYCRLNAPYKEAGNPERAEHTGVGSLTNPRASVGGRDRKQDLDLQGTVRLSISTRERAKAAKSGRALSYARMLGINNNVTSHINPAFVWGIA